MRVLISAYACEPGKGSEPEVGFRTVLAVAEQHEVWVLTRQNNSAALTKALEDHPDGSRVTVVGFDLGERALRLKRRTRRLGTLWYYDRWQKAIEDVAVGLDREHGFDVVHHLTFAAHWGRIGVSRVEKPLVVGPLGGAARTPLPLLPLLGIAGIPGEIGRRMLRPLVARATGARRAQCAADVILAQNPAAATAIGIPDRTEIVPNGLIGATTPASGHLERSAEERFVFAGRLIAWKGPLLAIRALAAYPSQSASLEIYGDGPQRRGLERERDRLGLEGRVSLAGPVPRDRLIERIATSTALVHPALHDDSPLTVAEALSGGTPVVCLDLAGPPVIGGYWPAELSRAVPATTPRAIVAGLARAMSEVVGAAGSPDPSPAARFYRRILDAYERALGPG